MGLVPLDSSINYDDSPKVWIADYLEEKRNFVYWLSYGGTCTAAQ